MTQKEAVILTLRKKNSITSWEAFTDWGITRLSAIIYSLRKEFEGRVVIDSEEVTKKNRFGHSTTFARYTVTPEGARILSGEKPKEYQQLTLLNDMG